MESKEQKIVVAAFRLFHQHGYRKVTMSDIAEAAGLSRPSLYAVYPNKEAVFAGFARDHNERLEQELAEKLPAAKATEDRLKVLFEIWIIAPFASVVDSPSGLDLLGNAATYAPEPVRQTYERFEHHLHAILKPEMPRKRTLSARDVAHVLTLATRGLKATTTSVVELRRLVDGLIIMAVATARAAE